MQGCMSQGGCRLGQRASTLPLAPVSCVSCREVGVQQQRVAGLTSVCTLPLATTGVAHMPTRPGSRPLRLHKLLIRGYLFRFTCRMRSMRLVRLGGSPSSDRLMCCARLYGVTGRSDVV